MKHLLIVGARGWGREVYAGFLGSDPYKRGEIDVRGFLDSKTDALDGLMGDYPPIICAPEDYEPHPDDLFFIAMGEPKWRKYYAEMMAAKGGKFHTIICDGAYINPTATIGEGCFICGWSSISDNVTIGKHCIVHVYCDLGHDTHVGDYVSLEAYTFCGGISSIGDESVMHVRSTLLRHQSIGRQVEVGTNSVVMRNVPDGQHVFGNPARKIEW